MMINDVQVEQFTAEPVTQAGSSEASNPDSVVIFSLVADSDFQQADSWLKGSLVSSSAKVKSMRTVAGRALQAFCRAKKITEKDLQAEVVEKARVGEAAVSITVSRRFLNSGDFFLVAGDFVTEFGKFFERAIDVSNFPVNNAEAHWRSLAEEELVNDENASAIIEAAMALVRESNGLPKRLKVISVAGAEKEFSKNLTAPRVDLKKVNTLPFEVTGKVPMVLAGYDFLTLRLFVFSLNDKRKKREVSIFDEQLREIRLLVDGRTLRQIELAGRSSRHDASVLDAAELRFISLVEAADQPR